MDVDVSQMPKSRQDDQQDREGHRSISEYQDTAYHSEDFPPQKPRQEKGFLRRMMTSGKPFSFSQTTDSITVYGLDKITPSEMAKIAATKQQEVYWDEQSLNGEGLTGWSQVYAIVVSITNGCLFMALPLCYAVFLLGLFIDKGGGSGRLECCLRRYFSGNYFVRDLTLFAYLPSLQAIACGLYVFSAVFAPEPDI
ncbi:putative transmembrane protein [Marinomonas primoryensis]|uniref:Putative transmembrane protein n=2 Tax=Marinomonas primoryensis TaxID=178399 RepID=A0A859CZB8_9GAMM|nr:putative transmembrane protein [Marinomonas primoryensis]